MGLRCPSAQPDMADAQVLGVVQQSSEGPRVSYVAGKASVTPELLEAVEPVPATHVLRIAARCETSRCRHFDGETCTLAARVAELLPEVVDALPPCAIRRDCRWFAEQGASVCRRCPQVVTQTASSLVDPRLLEGSGAPQLQAGERHEPRAPT